jgi:serine/threonine protein kinase
VNNDIFEQFLKKNKVKYQEDEDSVYELTEESEDSMNFNEEDFVNENFEEGKKAIQINFQAISHEIMDLITKPQLKKTFPVSKETQPIMIENTIDPKELVHLSRIGILADELDDENDSEDEGIEDYKEGGYHPVFIGECLIGRYVVLQKLGWGHFSTVWLCKDLKFDTYVAIKLQKSASHYLEAAFDEVEILQKAVKHAETKEWYEDLNRLDEGRKNHYSREDCYTVQLLNAFIYQGPYGKHFCMVFEILGVNLLEIIKRYKYKGVPIDICRKISRQILIGLHYLHKHCGIIHTDLKPENVLLCLDESDLADIIKHKQLYKNEKTEKRLNMMRKKINNNFQKENKENQANQSDSDKENNLIEEGAETKIMNLNEQLEKNLNFSKKTSVNRVIDNGSQRHIEDLLIPKEIEEMNNFEPKVILNDVSEDVSETDESKIQSLNSLPTEGIFNLMILTPKEMFNEVQQIIQEEQVEDNEEIKKIKKRIKRKMKRHKKRWKGMSEKEKEDYLASKEIYLLQRKHKNSFNLVDDPNVRMELRKISDNSQAEQRISTKNQESRKKVETYKYNENASDLSVGLKSNFKIKIADLGNGCWTHYHFQPEIQTRQYRGPEVILGINYNETADLWSFACMLFEMLTGDFLFDPKKSEEFKKNDDHLAQMMELLNEFPKDWSTIGTGSKRYIDKDGKLKKIRSLRFWGLKNILMQRYKMAEHEAIALEDFLMPMLRVLPQERATAEEMINHYWLDMKGNDFKSKDVNMIIHNDQDQFKRIINEQDHYVDKSSDEEDDEDDEDDDFVIEGIVN